ncbi:hypothetical protein SAMN04487948_11380 [Halogranum amylolyticum]|uniref:DUF6884 domain-containing protein n=1 Tax=Halogranum amylolyticum TaxID=660520 RepID=A0A1H8UZQ0_9EURY|nr:DUF6884 domain-containing protein [Halogranum amylolyticum]SEP08457.1 hypothetical protein SAMN04487948_11380 [Halogranum amylolyticum]
MTEVGLASCTKSKRDAPAKPRDLYDTPTLFTKVRSYVDATHDEWYVLSAKHHLLDPAGAEIDPYDETLTTAGVEARREWATVVCEQLRKGTHWCRDDTRHSRWKKYYEELLPHLEKEECDIEIPTEGLQIGETLSWYTSRT